MLRCPSCGSEQRTSARFCDQCGAALSSAGVPTSPLMQSSAGVPTSPLNTAMSDWVVLGDYAVRLLGRHAMPLDDQPGTQSVCVEVEYHNQGLQPLPYRLSQWMLYDTRGYAYTFELINRLYQGRELQKLPDGLLAPGKYARGLVAFRTPAGVRFDYLQFRPNATATEAADFPLQD
jgi:hypothetical protein